MNAPAYILNILISGHAMSYDQNIADRLWAGASKQVAEKQYGSALYRSYRRWERLRPENLGFITWMAEQANKHTGDPRLQLEYMHKRIDLVTKTDKDSTIALRLKLLIFKIENSLCSSVDEYIETVSDINVMASQWSSIADKAPSLNVFYAMMILRPTVLDAYLTAFYKYRNLKAPKFDHTRKIGRKIGFLWLSINTDPSYKCLKPFITALAALEDVCIYFDDVKLSRDVMTKLAPAEIRCIGGKSSEEVAQILYDDKVKILINNFFDRTRGFDVFAMRPCPVALNFMGVPGRYLNPSLFQYAISDRYMVEEFDAHKLKHAERSIIMPRYYQMACSLKDIKPRPRSSVKRIGILGRPLKLTPNEQEVIRRILSKHKHLEVVVVCSETDLPRVTDAMLDNGLLPTYFDRIKTAYQTKSDCFGGVLNSIDLCIDTFSHFGALSTGIEILSTGCPLISVRGPTLFSCHAKSLLMTVGIDDELLCENADDMVDKIDALVLNDERFGDLCSKLSLGLKSSRLNDVDFRAKEFSDMLRVLERDVDAGKLEDIIVPDASTKEN